MLTEGDKQTARRKRESAQREVDAQKFRGNRASKVSIIILLLWIFISFILVAVITAAPWYLYIFVWNLVATVPFATLFVWAILFEVCHVCYTLALKIGVWIAAAYNFWRHLVDNAYNSLIKLPKRRGAVSFRDRFCLGYTHPIEKHVLWFRSNGNKEDKTLNHV